MEPLLNKDDIKQYGSVSDQDHRKRKSSPIPIDPEKIKRSNQTSSPRYISSFTPEDGHHLVDQFETTDVIGEHINDAYAIRQPTESLNPLQRSLTTGYSAISPLHRTPTRELSHPKPSKNPFSRFRSLSNSRVRDSHHVENDETQNQVLFRVDNLGSPSFPFNSHKLLERSRSQPNFTTHIPSVNITTGNIEIIDVVSPQKKDSEDGISFDTLDNSIQDSPNDGGDLRRQRRGRSRAVRYKCRPEENLIPPEITPGFLKEIRWPTEFGGDGAGPSNQRQTRKDSINMMPDFDLNDFISPLSAGDPCKIANVSSDQEESPYSNIEGPSNIRPREEYYEEIEGQPAEIPTGRLEHYEVYDIEKRLKSKNDVLYGWNSNKTSPFINKGTKKVYDKNGELVSISPLTSGRSSDNILGSSALLKSTNDDISLTGGESSVLQKMKSPGRMNLPGNSVFNEVSTTTFTNKGSSGGTIPTNVVSPYSPGNSDHENVIGFLQSFARSRKRTFWVIFILILIIIIIIVSFVITTSVLSKGTPDIVKNFFDKANSQARNEILQNLIQKYNISSADILGKGIMKKSPWINNSSRPSLEYHHMDNTSVPSPRGVHDFLRNEDSPLGFQLGGYNEFQGLNSQYEDDEEIRILMEDERLRQGTTFYGVCYAPRSVIYPICGVNFRDIVLDLALLSKVTTRIKTYGMQCNQVSLIMDAILDLGINMTVSIGVWIGEDEIINRSQLHYMEEVLRKYPRRLFENIMIGNEALFREEQTSYGIIQYIKEARDIVASLGWKGLPIGTSEIGSKLDEEIIDNCDIVGANVHPFFSGETVKIAADWTYDFVKYQLEPLKEKEDGTFLETQYVITEVGWPYKGGEYGNAIAGPKHMQYFLDNFVCEAYRNSYGWYWFEAFDEPWKQIYHEDGMKWETEWGLFTSERNFKEGISLPSC